MTRDEVYASIDSERTYQEQRWSNSRPKLISSYILYMEHYMEEARKLCSTTNETPGTESAMAIMDVLRKVTALGVACGEEHKMP